MRVLVSGSSGLIGTALVDRLESSGHEVTRLVRRDPRPGEVRWDPAGGTIDAAGVDGHDAVVHLAGESIGGKRLTPAQKDVVRRSRVDSTTLLCTAITSASKPPSVWVSGSAVGYYGDRDDEILDEASAPGDDFMAVLCQDWEAAAQPATEAGIRVVNIRTGIVLSTRGGALEKQLPLFKLGLGGRLAGGDQWLSWIHIDDEVSAIVHALTDASLSGGVNLTAPEPVRNREFTAALGRALHRPAFLAVPRFALNLVLGTALVDTITASQRVLPQRLEASGFTFAFPALDAALRDVLS